jgi:hypothetical protein
VESMRDSRLAWNNRGEPKYMLSIIFCGWVGDQRGRLSYVQISTGNVERHVYQVRLTDGGIYRATRLSCFTSERGFS